MAHPIGPGQTQKDVEHFRRTTRGTPNRFFLRSRPGFQGFLFGNRPKFSFFQGNRRFRFRPISTFNTGITATFVGTTNVGGL